MQKLLIATLVLLAPVAAIGQDAGAQNVLVIIADDIGVDRVRAYGYVNDQGLPVSGPTPNIDALAQRGVLFRNVWSNPICSPTRATALSGRYSLRTGLGLATFQSGNPEHPGLRDDLRLLPKLMPADVYCAAIAKWHLADALGTPWTSGYDHPIRCGFDYHAGSIANFISDQSYDRWIKIVSTSSGTQSMISQDYATTDATDETLAVIHSRGADPWFIWLAYHAPHIPFHAPPSHLHTQDLPSGDPDQHPVAHTKAMVEAMDTEIGRLLAGIPEDVLSRTTIIFLGDNGTLDVAIEPPFPSDHGKGTMFNGGIHVPFIVAGAAVASSARGQETLALVNTTDLYVSIAELMGVAQEATAGIDSVSFLPHLLDPGAPSTRGYLYAERFKPGFISPAVPDSFELYFRAIREARYKLITEQGQPNLMFDMELDYHELHDLVSGGLSSEQQRIMERLLALMPER